MAVLVCGGAGYIGSHVNKQLYKEGYETVVFDNLIYGHWEAVKWGHFIQGDLKNLDEIEAVFKEYNIEAVFHFAAFAYVGESVVKPEKYYYNNVTNTLNLLHVMKKYGCNKLIFSSTCATYGEPERVPITEEMKQNPINPYGASKLMVERIFQDYNKAYGLKFVVFRYFNAAGADPEGEIGESHTPETHLIPLVLDAASGKRRDIKVFGTDYATPDGSCIRDYIHVYDLATAHLLALHYLEEGKESNFFNLGNALGTSVLEVVKTVKKVTGRDFTVTLAERRAGDPARLVGSSEKAQKMLGWKPIYGDIDIIVEHAWKWHEKAEY
ncbi:UDP-glucose 4-epimerase GalE [Parablautia muri]|uniref:UDP-glucose 4-epimerase n=1 Tax=Parablautia muri TaxID=2320879 RepID=A0A9X5BHS5_9FIRM|nr:UDP-glucose 4-epimerase GalE [Parablautia muri]NBJ94038.1 UDP-glucose 4-epimerase GalE [Parablautia muri]